MKLPVVMMEQDIPLAPVPYSRFSGTAAHNARMSERADAKIVRRLSRRALQLTKCSWHPAINNRWAVESASR
jgi:hypothetical protein